MGFQGLDMGCSNTMHLFCFVQKTDLFIPRNETAQPRSQFLHSCTRICARFLYSQYRSSYLASAKSWEYINRSQILEYGNWETEHYDSVLEIMEPRSFISGNTSIGTRHLWILTDPSFVVHVCIKVGLLRLESAEQQTPRIRNIRILFANKIL